MVVPKISTVINKINELEQKNEELKTKKWSTEKKIDKPGSVKTNIIIAISGFIISILAIYYYLQQPDKMLEYWNAFLEVYRRLITKGKISPRRKRSSG